MEIFKKRLNIIILIMIVVVFSVIGYYAYQKTTREVVFSKTNPEIEINGNFDAIDNIIEVKDGKIEDVSIDDSELRVSKLGTYPVFYKYHDEIYSINVSVVDSTPPVVKLKQYEIDLGMSVNPDDVIDKVEDATKTTASFKEDYDFNKEGDVKVTVVVKDEADNETESSTIVKVLSQDNQAPLITGVVDLKANINQKIDLLANVEASDNRDPKPSLTVDDSNLDISKLGDYQVVYKAKDRSGNITTKSCTVSVITNAEIGTTKQSNQKIIYLTFDDGPSVNTQAILDTLDKYNAKATFFVTGINPNYYYLIKEAHKRGHTIGMHTYSHNYAQIYSSVPNYFDDLEKISKIVKQQIGYVPKYIRFPGGSSNTISKRYCYKIMSRLTKAVINRGYQYYDWNGDFEDGTGTLTTSKLIKNATVGEDNNIIILAHDALGKETTAKALGSVIKYWQAKGYRFEGINDSSYVNHHTVHN